MISHTLYFAIVSWVSWVHAWSQQRTATWMASCINSQITRSTIRPRTKWANSLMTADGQQLSFSRVSVCMGCSLLSTEVITCYRWVVWIKIHVWKKGNSCSIFKSREETDHSVKHFWGLIVSPVSRDYSLKEWKNTFLSKETNVNYS